MLKKKKVFSVLETMIEGVDYINVNRNSKTELGLMLSPSYPHEVNTPYGKAGNVKAFLEYVTTIGYPRKLLKKSSLTQKEISSIPKEKVELANYDSVLVYILSERIMNDEKLKKLLIENELPFTSINEKTTKTLFSSNVKISLPNVKLGRYLSAIEEIAAILKRNGGIEDLEALMNNVRADKTVGVFSGAAIMTDMIEESNDQEKADTDNEESVTADDNDTLSVDAETETEPVND